MKVYGTVLMVFGINRDSILENQAISTFFVKHLRIIIELNFYLGYSRLSLSHLKSEPFPRTLV